MPTSSTETQERSVIMNATIPTLTHATIHDYYGHNPFTGYVQYIKYPDQYTYRLVLFGPKLILKSYYCRISNLTDSKIPFYPYSSLVKYVMPTLSSVKVEDSNGDDVLKNFLKKEK